MVRRAVADLADCGVRRSTAAPWPYRLAWLLGVPLRPPHFQSFLAVFALHTLVVWLSIAVPLAVVFGLWLDAEAAAVAAVYSLAVPLIAGLSVAVYYRLTARRLGLPAWEEYTADADYDAGW